MKWPLSTLLMAVAVAGVATVAKDKIPFRYRSPDATVYRRQISVIQGPEKTGKTHFACTAPGPVLLINTDQGDEGVVTPDKFPGKEIYIVDISPGTALVAAGNEDEADKAFAEFKEAHRWGLSHCNTIIWDKADQIWELARLVLLGKLTNVKPHHYTEVNNTFRYLIKEADKAKNLNLLLIHNMKEEWVNEKFTGRLVRAGFKETGGLVQTCITTKFEDGEFAGTIDFCRQNMELVGTEMTGRFFDFDNLLELVFG
jgi:hypothetical protein